MQAVDAAIVLAARERGERMRVGGGAGAGGGEEEWHSKGEDGGGRFVAGSGRDGQHPLVRDRCLGGLAQLVHMPDATRHRHRHRHSATARMAMDHALSHESRLTSHDYTVGKILYTRRYLAGIRYHGYNDASKDT